MNGIEDPAISELTSTAEAEHCARMMSTSEPWVTLGRTYETSLRLLQDPLRERYVARAGEEIAGFLILITHGALVGYVQTVCVAPGQRGRGLGSRLLAFAEQRLFRDFPNVFMCVSSFNTRARALYERLGYRQVGELEEFIVPGHSEILLRKRREG